MDVRGDQEHPREQADADRQDRGIDQGRKIATRVPALDEQKHSGHQGRVDRQVEPVAEGREADVSVEQLRVAVGVEVAAEKEELAEDEQPPGRPGLRLVDQDAGDDPDHA